MKATTILFVLLVGTSSILGAELSSARLIKTATTLTSSENPSDYGDTVTFTAAVTPAPPDGETITFMQGKNPLGTGTLSGGTTSYATSAMSPGTYTIKAVYTSDGIYAGSTSNAVKQVVDKIPTATTLSSSQNPINFKQPVTFTTTVAADSGGTPTGNVSFYNGTAKLGTASLSSGVANYTTTRLPAGTDSITGVYNGSTLFAASTSNIVGETVNGGCGTGTFIDSSMMYGNPPTTRYYEVYLPAGLLANPPMVLMLHGTRSTIETGSDPMPVISLNWGWQPVAEQNCFILVKPASTYDPATAKWNWNAYFLDEAFPYAQGCGATDCPDDSGFLGALINALITQYNVNPNMVYVAGFSSGAEMAERVGADLAGLVAAIAPGSGQLVAVPGVVSPPLPYPNDPQASVSVQEWHGTLDTNLWPCGYGTTIYNADIFTLDTVDDTFNFWTTAPVNSCTTLLTTAPLCLNGAPNNTNDAPMLGIPGLTGNDATGCANNAEIQFIWMPDVQHSWQQQYNAERWAFFLAHPKHTQPKPRRKIGPSPPAGNLADSR